jgi:hypothetical protein
MQIVPVLLPAAQVGTLAGRATVATHIVGIDGRTASREVARKIGIEATVIAQAMEVDEHGAGSALGGEPGLIVERDSPGPRKPSFAVLDGMACGVAHRPETKSPFLFGNVGSLLARSGERGMSTAHQCRCPFEQPTFRLRYQLTDKHTPNLARRDEVRAIGREVKVIECRAGVTGVFSDELRQRPRPAFRGRAQAGSAAVPLECRNHESSRDAELPVALPKVPFVLPDIDVARTHEIAGTASYQEPCYRLRFGMQRSQRLLVNEPGEISHGSMGQHGPDLAQGERAGDVEEVAQGGTDAEFGVIGGPESKV